MITRRGFLAYSATVYAAMRAGRVMAQSTAAPNVLWMQLFATGGWDQMLFCDPKLGVRASASGAHQTAGQVQSASGITYVNTSADVSTFFTSHASRLLVINGIDTGTNNHDVGVRYCMGGSVLEGFPVFSAQVAGVLGKSKVMPLINISGYDEAGGLLAPVRMDYIGVPAMAKLQTPNRPEGEYNNTLNYDTVNESSPFLQDSVRTLVKSAHHARLARKLAAARLPNHKNGIAALQQARAASDGLPNIDVPSTPDGPQANFANLVTMGVQAFQSGLATSINIAVGSHDSHGIADSDHLLELAKVFSVANQAVSIADSLDVPIIIVMSSDFGRTPVREGAGSGHWPVSSMMILQNERAKQMSLIPTGKTIGGTTGEATSNNSNLTTVLQARKINPATHAFSDTGTLLTPAHVYASLRRVAGISDQLRAFPISIDGAQLELV